MLYAREVTKYLMVLHPNEDVRMIDLVAFVEPAPKTDSARHRIRVAVYRVLKALIDSGVVLHRPSSHRRGGFSTYRWVVRESDTRTSCNDGDGVAQFVRGSAP